MSVLLCCFLAPGASAAPRRRFDPDERHRSLYIDHSCFIHLNKPVSNNVLYHERAPCISYQLLQTLHVMGSTRLEVAHVYIAYFDWRLASNPLHQSSPMETRPR
ncbi:hypothetical protein B0F90DRAFT_1299182 [Multifurca ochricompacta]|uniref:Secreted protein n=1 Tax=Multifurca ochricompacta TaxID=376703 RepID=A0AAD4QPV7_9AGAM|nr:hypothetical protein B0F90DRAFT_1299182 [Multifurca ochricompacta]